MSNIRQSDARSLSLAWPLVSADIERIQGRRRRVGGVSFPSLPARVRETLRAVFADHGVTLSEFYGEGQTKRLSEARWDACARLRRMVLLNGGTPSTTQIGGWIGMDHTSVMHGLRKLEARAAK